MKELFHMFLESFDGFETIVLEHKQVHCMTGVYGRVRRFSSFVITGNGNGLCGIGLAKSPDLRSGLKKAKNRAGNKLMYIERYNNHTGEKLKIKITYKTLQPF